MMGFGIRRRFARTRWGAAALGFAIGGAACDVDEPEDLVDEPVIGDEDYERDASLNIELVSEAAGDSSHNAGENCMHCHQPRGPGPGLFTSAGTVYNSDGTLSAGATVELWTGFGGSGELRVAVEADSRGNFFTTEPVEFFGDEALFPFVRAADGERTTLMPFPTRSGACNVCHVGGFIVEL